MRTEAGGGGGGGGFGQGRGFGSSQSAQAVSHDAVTPPAPRHCTGH